MKENHETTHHADWKIAKMKKDIKKPKRQPSRYNTVEYKIAALRESETIVRQLKKEMIEDVKYDDQRAYNRGIEKSIRVIKSRITKLKAKQI